MHSPESGVIRAARSDDAKAMHECVIAAYSHYVERLGTAPGPMLDDYERVACSELAFVVEFDDQVVGLAVLLSKSGGLLLDNIAVHPRHAGRGLGKRLMAFVETTAMNLGHDVLTLYTHELMHENLAMYAALGYAVLERRVEHGFARVYLHKALSRRSGSASR